jgi:cytochrome P450 family 6
MRFGLMQAKIGLIQLITKFKFSVSDKTPIPMKFKIHGFSLSSAEDVFLKVEKV